MKLHVQCLGCGKLDTVVKVQVDIQAVLAGGGQTHFNLPRGWIWMNIAGNKGDEMLACGPRCGMEVLRRVFADDLARQSTGVPAVVFVEKEKD